MRLAESANSESCVIASDVNNAVMILESYSLGQLVVECCSAFHFWETFCLHRCSNFQHHRDSVIYVLWQVFGTLG
jgi:hypothetical protein